MNLLKWFKSLLHFWQRPNKKSIDLEAGESVPPVESVAVVETVEVLLAKPQAQEVITALHEPLIVPNIQSTPAASELFFLPEAVATLPIRFDKDEPFFPNWGDLDPTVSTISDGRPVRESIGYQYQDFIIKYGDLTTDLGYGLIYSIIKHAVEKEDRTLKSAVREAIARSGNALLCIAVAKDYCFRVDREISLYEKFFDRLRVSSSSDINTPDKNGIALPVNSESQSVEEAQWLFNGQVMEVNSLFLKVRVLSKSKATLVREFNKTRKWVTGQNVVLQWEQEDQYRILDFRRK